MRKTAPAGIDHAATVSAGYFLSQGAKRTKLAARSSVAEPASSSPIQASPASAPSAARSPRARATPPKAERGADGLQPRQRLQTKRRGDDHGRQGHGSEDHGAAGRRDVDHSGAEHPWIQAEEEGTQDADGHDVPAIEPRAAAEQEEGQNRDRSDGEAVERERRRLPLRHHEANRHHSHAGEDGGRRGGGHRRCFETDAHGALPILLAPAGGGPAIVPPSGPDLTRKYARGGHPPGGAQRGGGRPGADSPHRRHHADDGATGDRCRMRGSGACGSIADTLYVCHELDGRNSLGRRRRNRGPAGGIAHPADPIAGGGGECRP